MLAVSVTSTRWRLVVGRSQRFTGGGRSGTQVSLASPAARDQWWFANGRKGADTSDRYSIYNPTDTDVEVDAIFVGIPEAVEAPEPIPVPAHEVVTFEPSTLAELPDGRYAVVFATLAEPSVVVERATTTVIDEQLSTTVVAGATTRPDGYLATTWHVPQAPSEPTAQALVIYNRDNAVGQLTVSAIGASGPVPVPGLTDIALPGPDGVLTIDLTDPIVLGRELIIESGNRIFVERAFPTGLGDLRASSWAIPAGNRWRCAGRRRPDRLVELVSMVRLLVAVAIVAVAAGVAAVVNRRRRADPPTQPPRRDPGADRPQPTSLSRGPVAGRRVRVQRAHTCADVISKAEVMRSDDVAVDVVPSRIAAARPRALRDRRRSVPRDRRPLKAQCAPASSDR